MGEMQKSEENATKTVQTGEGPSGEGVDRTLIRQRLVLTPAERISLVVREANNVAGFLSAIRR